MNTKEKAIHDAIIAVLGQRTMDERIMATASPEEKARIYDAALQALADIVDRSPEHVPQVLTVPPAAAEEVIVAIEAVDGPVRMFGVPDSKEPEKPEKKANAGTREWGISDKVFADTVAKLRELDSFILKDIYGILPAGYNDRKRQYAARTIADSLLKDGSYTLVMETYVVRLFGERERRRYVRVNKEEAKPEETPKEVPKEEPKEEPKEMALTAKILLLNIPLYSTLLKTLWDNRLEEYVGLTTLKEDLIKQNPGLLDTFNPATYITAIKEAMQILCKKSVEKHGVLVRAVNVPNLPSGSAYKAAHGTMKFYAKSKGWKI